MHPGARCDDAHEVVFPPVPHGEHGRAVLHGSCRHSLYERATLTGTEPICGVAVSASVLKNGNTHPRKPTKSWPLADLHPMHSGAHQIVHDVVLIGHAVEDASVRP